MDDEDNFVKIILLCSHQLKLRKCTIRGINAGNKGLYFGHFNKRRPQTAAEGLSKSAYFLGSDVAGESDWVSVYTSAMNTYEVRLDADEGDDIKYWLQQLTDKYKLERMWTIHDLRCW